jgi:hypothetical protein
LQVVSCIASHRIASHLPFSFFPFLLVLFAFLPPSSLFPFLTFSSFAGATDVLLSPTGEVLTLQYLLLGKRRAAFGRRFDRGRYGSGWRNHYASHCLYCLSVCLILRPASTLTDFNTHRYTLSIYIYLSLSFLSTYALSLSLSRLTHFGRTWPLPRPLLYLYHFYLPMPYALSPSLSCLAHFRTWPWPRPYCNTDLCSVGHRHLVLHCCQEVQWAGSPSLVFSATAIHCHSDCDSTPRTAISVSTSCLCLLDFPTAPRFAYECFKLLSSAGAIP